MLKYIIIPLARNAVSFCQYARGVPDNALFPIEELKRGILWAMKENLNIQFLYPDFELPLEYKHLIDSVDHTDIISSKCSDSALKQNAEIIVFDSWEELSQAEVDSTQGYVLRTARNSLFEHYPILGNTIKRISRLVIVITDIESFTETDFKKYEELLNSLIPVVKAEYGSNHAVQLNILTDRIFLTSMNNCNAGWESITLAPNGKFYVCPAFYLDDDKPVGDLYSGIDIKNPQLFKIDHAPICRNCDAFQCCRCVWLNRKTTLEVNTPSHEQCTVAHIERNASEKLLASIRELGEFLPDKDIPEIDYIDPLTTIIKH